MRHDLPTAARRLATTLMCLACLAGGHAARAQGSYPVSLTLSPSSVTGGTSVAAVVTLNAPAPAGTTTTAKITSSSPAVTVPAYVTFPAGSSSVQFTVTTTPVASATAATLTAYNSKTVTATLTVAPPAASSVGLSPAAVTGGSSSTGTVTLTGPAPSGGTAVSLTSNSTSATVPSSITVPAGSSSTTFTVSTTSVTSATTATVSAAAGGATKTATLTVNPAPAMPFQIPNVSNGNALSGDFPLTISVSSSSISSQNLNLFIDGTPVSSAQVEQADNGTLSAEFTVETNDYMNGAHTVEVTDDSGDSQTRTVTFSNNIEGITYDTIFDLTPGVTDVPGTSTITASLATPGAWQIQIQDNSGNVLRTFSGSGSSINVTWNGTDRSGNVVADGTYMAVFGTGTNGNAAQPLQQGTGTPVTRPIAKDSIGDTLILFDVDAFSEYSQPSKIAVAQSYANFIQSELNPKVGTDFVKKPSVLLVTGPQINSNVNLRNRILNKFKVPLNLVYVFAHGDTHVGGGIFQVSTPPLFQLGNYLYFSQYPKNFQSAANDINVGQIVSSAGLSYGDMNTPPSLVWMDNCQSAGFNPVVHDWTWASDFGIDIAEQNGYSQGIFLGWSTGGSGGISDAVPYGHPTASPYYNWSIWREYLWDHLFNGGKNFITSLNQVDDITPRNGTLDPQQLHQYLGIQSTAF